MSREVPFFENDICDICGTKGAYDFMGYQLCPECTSKYVDAEKDNNVFLGSGQCPFCNGDLNTGMSCIQCGKNINDIN